jgi:hypothetical protein
LDVFFHNLFPFSHPFFPIRLGIGQVFVTTNTKAATTCQFFGQWNDVKIKKTNLSLVPTQGWIRVGTAGLEGTVQFKKESLIPLLVNAVFLEKKVTKSIRQYDENE